MSNLMMIMVARAYVGTTDAIGPFKINHALVKVNDAHKTKSKKVFDMGQGSTLPVIEPDVIRTNWLIYFVPRGVYAHVISVYDNERKIELRFATEVFNATKTIMKRNFTGDIKKFSSVMLPDVIPQGPEDVMEARRPAPLVPRKINGREW